ncbi:MAG: AzlD domain-containing protein [Rhizobiales bacterium]|nr:AzlD domain-containing protein [Hyphomicrobiales bacterium]
MTNEQWFLIIALGIGAYSIRFLGLIMGKTINDNQHLKKLLDNLPACLVVALVASSLAEADPITWFSALIALGVAIITNHVVLTMIIGFSTIYLLKLI